MKEIKVLLATIVALYSVTALAQVPMPVPAPAPSTAPACTPPPTNEAASSGLPAGVYNTPSGTLYTTGDKKPFIVDPPCSNTPPVQPYVEYNAPTAGGSSTSSTTTATTGTAPAAPMRR